VKHIIAPARSCNCNNFLSSLVQVCYFVVKGNSRHYQKRNTSRFYHYRMRCIASSKLDQS